MDRPPSQSPTHSLISPSAARGESVAVCSSRRPFSPRTLPRPQISEVRPTCSESHLRASLPTPHIHRVEWRGGRLYSLNPDGLRIESIPFSRFRGEARRDCEARLRQRAAALPLTPAQNRSLRRPSSLLTSPRPSAARASGISFRSGDLPFHLLGN